MTSVRINDVVRKLKGRLARGDSATATDSALLERFLSRRDEEAFAELVRRHGGLVYGVCRRLLRNQHDAEDAFQATFLVLVRKGSAVRRVRSVGCWLYGVARRTALEARRAAARRRAREARAMTAPATEIAQEDCDLREVLDAEIDQLPEKLRAPLLLCDLEGKTRREAARHLGCPEGTVASRLAAARTMLAKRLTRRGVSLAGGAFTVAMAGETAGAVPPGLASSTVRVATGRALTSSGVAALVKGVLTTMLLKKLRTGVVVILTVVILGAGGTFFRGAGATEAGAAEPSKPRSELDALRHENELLRLNLNVVLEKVHAQEAELQVARQALRAESGIQFNLGFDGGSGMKMGGPGGSPHGEFKFDVQKSPAAGSGSSSTGTSSASGALTGSSTGFLVGATTPMVTPTFKGNVLYVTELDKQETQARRIAAALQHTEAALRGLREAKRDNSRPLAIMELEAAQALLKVEQAKLLDTKKGP